MDDNDDLITTEQLAAELSVPPSRLHKARVSGIDSPPFIKLGRLVRYRRGDIRNWIASKPRANSTSERG
ncbi:DNA-binding protein [Sphingosinicella sp. LHD-64]|uniref:helix-turn-helix transcriptional regulator n=1 Tax=Sphingosinicella sp. LHD-64 TaxID=3072139 RepID=UPI00280C7819|nr:DNA-binding protein [Sphingosinicella sp. LHD-64]MDQ8757489.1 DNA-binding protein [Sphingosinicella sp. LHD-64]